MFEYYGNIHVYCPGVGADEPLGSIFFSESLIFSPTAHLLQDFHFKSFPYSNALATYVDLAVKKRSRSSQGHDLYTHCST